jgi:hypothetical protein
MQTREAEGGDVIYLRGNDPFGSRSVRRPLSTNEGIGKLYRKLQHAQ